MTSSLIVIHSIDSLYLHAQLQCTVSLHHKPSCNPGEVLKNLKLTKTIAIDGQRVKLKGFKLIKELAILLRNEVSILKATEEVVGFYDRQSSLTI